MKTILTRSNCSFKAISRVSTSNPKRTMRTRSLGVASSSPVRPVWLEQVGTGGKVGGRQVGEGATGGGRAAREAREGMGLLLIGGLGQNVRPGLV